MDDNSDKKDQMESLLESLSQEQIEQLESLLQKSSVTSRNTRKKRRRGKGRRKKRERERNKEETAPTPSEEEPMEEDFTLGLRLTASEREELAEASKFDKEAGVTDAPERPKKVTKNCFVEIRCRICGNTNKVSRGLVPPEATRYKCNTCACSAG
tara:strand:- start:1384 stop:1848 length:465 start_codon:yes stop_codon:yes gene_type:complete